MKIDQSLQQAFVLHTRAYRNTSMLVDFFTQQHGLISAVVRGARGKQSKNRPCLQAFTPLLISWRGRGELVNVYISEQNGPTYQLDKYALYSGFYLNELIVRLMQRYDPHQVLFQCYQQSLSALAQHQAIEVVLRRFELVLLQELGYGLAIEDVVTENQQQTMQFYHYFPEIGFQLAQDSLATEQPKFLGQHLLAIAQQDFSSPEVLTDAKRLLRIALNPLLANKPIMSRTFFRSLES